MTFQLPGTPGFIGGEKDVFPLSAVAVEMAIPVFIGYTQKAEQNGKSLLRRPTRISSLGEYQALFGEGVKTRFTVGGSVADGSAQTVVISGKQMQIAANVNEISYFYPGIRMFFANGGEVCYILSLGTYPVNAQNPGFDFSLNDFTGSGPGDSVFDLLEKEAEPTMILVPDLIRLGAVAYGFYEKILLHCGTMGNRIGIFDLRYMEQGEKTVDLVQEFRDKTGNLDLNFGAAYFPWLHTTILGEEEVNIQYLDPSVDLGLLLPETGVQEILDRLNGHPDPEVLLQIHHSLKAASPAYTLILKTIRFILNELPPSTSIAGIITTADNTRGVWKAPANMALQSVDSLTINISDAEQENLHVDVMGGKSVNAIRTFSGEGVLVWGARTLDGNSTDWKYISVRRTLIMIEQSLMRATREFVFEPNISSTWEAVKGMASNFLSGLWRQGALQGTTPGQAFGVDCGLGTTMTPDDILNGSLKVTIRVAITHPAEFMVITFQQQLKNHD